MTMRWVTKDDETASMDAEEMEEAERPRTVPLGV
jgi:hypothetical protein